MTYKRITRLSKTISGSRSQPTSADNDKTPSESMGKQKMFESSFDAEVFSDSDDGSGDIGGDDDATSALDSIPVRPTDHSKKTLKKTGNAVTRSTPDISKKTGFATSSGPSSMNDEKDESDADEEDLEFGTVLPIAQPKEAGNTGEGRSTKKRTCPSYRVASPEKKTKVTKTNLSCALSPLPSTDVHVRGGTADVQVRREDGSAVNVAFSNDQVTVIRNEISMLRGVLGDFSKSIRSYVDSHHTETTALLKRTIGEVVELRAVVDLSVSDNKDRKDGAKMNEVEVPFFNFVFSDEVMQVVIEKCTISHVTYTAMEYHSRKEKKSTIANLARGGALALRIMLFAVNLKKKESRTMYKTEVGQRFSEFREGIILTALNAAQQNKFNIFRIEDDLKGEETGGIANSRKAPMPKWLAKDFVTTEHISWARMKAEETATPWKIDGLEGNAEVELALSAAHMLYKRLNQKLNSARMMSKAGFFDEIGYLFVDWKSFGCKADQSTLQIRWKRSDSPAEFPDIKSVPDSIPKVATKDNDSVDDINKMNKKLLHDLSLECGNMELEISHEVYIRKQLKRTLEKKEEELIESATDTTSQASSDHTDGDEQKDTIVYTVSILDISCRLLSGYTSQLQYTPPASFLSASTNSLRSVFAVSVLLKNLLQKVMKAMDDGVLDNNEILNEFRVNGFNLSALLPTPARQKNGLRTRSVHMFQHLFNARSKKYSGHGTASSIVQSGGTPAKVRKTTVIEIE